MKNCPKMYKGQALAISMIVLVVCSILGLSIYSRVVKDKELVTQEAISSEALEMADSILGTMTAVSASDLKALIEGNGGDIAITGWIDVNLFLEDLDLINLTDTLQDLDQCSATSSTVELVISEATMDDLIEVRVDEAKAFRIEGKTITSPCSLSVQVESRGTINSGFVVKNIYGEGYEDTAEYKMYDEDDILLYCFSEDLLTCNSKDFIPSDNWIKISDGEILDLDLTETKEGYALDEVRIIPMGGTIGVGIDVLPEGCMEDEDLGAVRIVTNITCNDIYRAKEMFVPEDGSTSYSSMFDFTIYNNIGILDL